MGPHQSSQQYNHTNIHQLFPQIKQYHPTSNHQINSQNYSFMAYKHFSQDKIATIRNYYIRGNKKPFIQAYYLQRSKIKQNPHIFQLMDIKITQSKISSVEPSTDVSSSLCSINTLRSSNNSGTSHIMWLFCQSFTISLQDQILNRVSKKSFEQIELWSVLSSCVLGAMTLLEQGFKQPVLSPKGIGLSKDGLVKVGQWEIISNIQRNYLSEQGEVLVGKYGQTLSEINKNSLNQLILNYYWAPEGLKAMENFISLGQKQSQISSHSQRNANYQSLNSQKFQVFSLGMTLISMCLRGCFYRTDTYSQKYLSKLTHQTIQIRKVEGKQLSNQMKFVIQSMVKWDPQQRITYSQLRDIILQYFTQHQQQMNNSSVSIKTFDYVSQSDQCKSKASKNKIKCQSRIQSQNTSMNLTQQHSFVDSYSFAVAQANMKIHNKVQQMRKKHSKSSQQHISSTSSAFQGYQGSGMIQQGTGDNDQHLQQKQQIQQCQEIQECSQDLSSQPVTHRTQKSLKDQIKIRSLISSAKRQNICPTSTPNINPSPRPYVQQYKTSLQTNKNPYIRPTRDLIDEKKKSYEYRTNQVYLMQNQQNQVCIPKLIKSRQRYSINRPPLQIQTHTENGYLLKSQEYITNCISNRGSYRSSNKYQPHPNSARPMNHKITQSYTMHSQIRQSLSYQNRQSSLSPRPIRHQIIIQYANGMPTKLNQMQRDQQDICNSIQGQGEYDIQNPDIFQTFQLNSDSINSMQNSIIAEINNLDNQTTKQNNIHTFLGYQNKQFIKKSLPNFQLTQNQQKQSKLKPNLVEIYQNPKKIETKQLKSKDLQFMTFNQSQPASIEDNFNQINLQNRIKLKNKEIIQLKNNEDQKLFTDPKLLQYIRSSFDPSKHSSIQNTSRFNTNQLFGSIGSSIKGNQLTKFNHQQRDKENSIYFCNNSKQFNNLKEKSLKDFNSANFFSVSSKQNQILCQQQSKNKIFEDNQPINSPTKSKIVKQQMSKGFYEGEKKNGVRSGYGVFYYNEGGKYKGNWLNNKMHGKGTLQYSDGRIAYQGEWSCDQLHGKGILYNQSPNCISNALNYEDLDQLDECWIYYEGLFEHDDKCGIGMLLLSNQQQFIGQFKNDMANGIGQYQRIDGSVVKGIWQDNKLIKIIPN